MPGAYARGWLGATFANLTGANDRRDGLNRSVDEPHLYGRIVIPWPLEVAKTNGVENSAAGR